MTNKIVLEFYKQGEQLKERITFDSCITKELKPFALLNAALEHYTFRRMYILRYMNNYNHIRRAYAFQKSIIKIILGNEIHQMQPFHFLDDAVIFGCFPILQEINMEMKDFKRDVEDFLYPDEMPPLERYAARIEFEEEFTGENSNLMANSIRTIRWRSFYEEVRKLNITTTKNSVSVSEIRGGGRDTGKTVYKYNKNKFSTSKCYTSSAGIMPLVWAEMKYAIENSIILKPCPVCDGMFVQNEIGRKSTYCSDKCKHEARLKRDKDRYGDSYNEYCREKVNKSRQK